MTELENPLIAKLREEFQRRQAKNNKYSLRAFALNLGMDPSNLSKIFRGERPLSESCINHLIKKLYGNEMVDTEFLKEVLESTRIQRVQMENPFCAAPTEAAETGEWQHFVLIEIARVIKINHTTLPWIAESLEVSTELLTKSLRDLVHWQIAYEQNGEYHFNGKNHTTMNIHGTSESLKAIQKVFLAMATRAIDRYEVAERENTTLTIAINHEQIPLIKSLLSKTRKKINKMSEATTESKLEKVYNLTMAFYPLTKEAP